MKFVSTLLKKFKKSSSSSCPPKTSTSTSEPQNKVWIHDGPSSSTENQNEVIEESQFTQRPLRRQNRFVGFNAMMGQKVRASQRYAMRMEKREMSVKLNESIRSRLRKQKRARHYRKLAEIQKQPKFEI
ncbi:Protein CBG26873 [Caenorhabditis briggsae]|uniref:Uncharacterized protein n=2 Tax=Caenorhabditis briggsae TaxID=6238 RepID=A0AAE8ZWD9_CAEBR|nr:Protein CBG26873 [Caenorhabditis briggsae]ULT85993.1 hypothetical protein L3Y34_005995 [Caenorhabditis briggsae]UMM31748.1 hypothetical protein L5515_005818 [Caenorhabditis briggsae]CAR99603.1 Protein CBG26873 [Caenorhabditis briggsae]